MLLRSACQPLLYCHMFSGVISQKDCFHMAFCVGCQPADIPMLMVSSCSMVVEDVMV